MAGFTLYELTGFYRTLADMDAEDTTLNLKEALDTVGGQLADKVENIAKLVRTLEAEANAYDQEANRLAKHMVALKVRSAGLKAYVLDNLQAAGLTVLQAGLFKVRVQNSPPSCEIVAEADLPDEYKTERVVVDVDRRAIIENWKATGADVPGAICRQGQHLRIYP